MKRFVWVACWAAIGLLPAILLHSAAAQEPDVLRNYRFISSKTDVHVSGGSSHYDMDLSIEGDFGLVTHYPGGESPVSNMPTLDPYAAFVNVHAILFNPLSAAPLPVPGWDLDEKLNLSNLTGTFSDASDIQFSGVDGQGIPIKLDAELRGPLLHLTGVNYLPPTCVSCTQYIGYKVDALAAIKPYADFNLDGMIDAADYSIWRSNMGLGTSATFEQGDANGDGIVNATDYVAWRLSVGAATSLSAFSDSGSGTISEAGAIPEPASILLSILCLAVTGSYWRERRI